MVTLREDSDFYCVLWLGMALLSAYYFNAAYLSLSLPGYFGAVQAYLLQLLGLPLLLVVLFSSYLKSSRGRYRPAVLALSIVACFFFVLAVTSLPDIPGVTPDWLFLSSWAIGSALLVAGGFSILPNRSEITSPGIIDVSSLKYGVTGQEDIEETN